MRSNKDDKYDSPLCDLSVQHDISYEVTTQ